MRIQREQKNDKMKKVYERQIANPWSFKTENKKRNSLVQKVKKCRKKQGIEP